MKVPPVAFAVAFAFFAFSQSPLPAQSKPAADASEAAYAVFSSGDYAGAAAAYQKILTDFPTDAVVSLATIQLAYSQFFLGQFDDALATLNKALSGPPLPPEMAEVAEGFLPQILSAKASSLPVNDPGRKAAFEQAIAKFTAFIEKYPRSVELESAIFGRALANFQIENYDKAIEDLRANVQRFAQSGTVASSKNLLALALATQGGQELMKPDGDKAKGMQLLKQGEDLLREIIANKRDIGLINDSYFQIGEILFTKASFSPEAERPTVYKQALEAYRSILPKSEIIKMQQQRIAGFPALKAAALRANNPALKKQLDKDNERALRSLSEIQAKPDQIPTALLKMGEIFFNAQQYNESRVVLSHVQPNLADADEKTRALYYKTMSYIIQSQVDKALAGYDQFIGENKGAAIAEGLPFAMGSMYLSLGNPTEAIRYFDESLKQYPTGRLAGLSVVSKAQAEAALGQFDSALATFKDYLAKNPPKDVAVVASFGLAGIYKDKASWDEAIKAYEEVKTKYPGTPQATDSDYWIAICTQQKGDNAAAIPLLEAFVKANPKHQMAALATYATGGAQIALGDKAKGLETLAKVAAEYPDSPPAPYTYFMRAQILAGDQKIDEMIALMRQFIEKYPQDDKIFFAFDSIAQSSANFGKPDEAIATYQEFSEKYPEHPKAAEALVKVVDLQRGNAERIATNYASLDAADQTRWKDALQQSISTAESIVAKYPDSTDLPSGLQSLLASQRLLLRAQLREPADVEKYLEELASKAPTPAAKSKVLFTLASFISETDKPRALAKMNEIYSAEIVYSPKDLDIYGLALVDDKKLDEATAVFQKLVKDYPVPTGTAANQAPLAVQEAQAVSLFGLGRVAQERKQTAEAGKLFQQLKALYPWSPKVLEADYGIAESLRASGKSEEAQQILTGVIRAQNATAELRAASFLLLGEITVDRMNAEADSKKKEDLRGAAIDNYLKIAQFYGGVPDAAATGLWRGAQLLEEQVAASTDAKFKAQQANRAREAYRQLLKDYPKSAEASKAQERLNALGTP